MSFKAQFGDSGIYHIINRAIEGQKLFRETSDYFRFITTLYELNNKNSIKIRDRIAERKINKRKGLPLSNPRELLVEIIALCLMPTHYHLVVRQIVDGGISQFFKKIGDGYVGYFNKKYQRIGRGSIFQGRPKKVCIKNEKQFANVICYVFTNPVELVEEDWKESGAKNSQKAIDYLNSYKWSSYLDCIGQRNFPSVTKMEPIFEIFGDAKNLKKIIESWILYKTEFKNTWGKNKDLFLALE
ncbi:MAG: hypothetical protein PHN44_02470 [Candidatus Marinimicrobia bacterium]|nr:hypothetical protein [Candidatus Neomarinimicrobiota bacterium]